MKPERTFTLFALRQQNLAWTDHFAGRQSLATRIWTVPKLSPILHKLFSP